MREFEELGFAEVWTPVFAARELKARRPLRRVVAGVPVVFVRNKAGKVGALLDRCPHRGVALSLGRADDAGTVTCRFHGWRFEGGTGACTHVPYNPDAKREQLFARAFPVEERGGLIWLFTRPGPHPEEGPPVPATFEDDAYAVQILSKDWEAHWTRAMENMLDVPHLPFVHRWTIGAGLRRRLGPDTRMDLETVVDPRGFRVRSRVDGVEDFSGLDWVRPNGMVLRLSEGRRVMRMHVWCVPIDARRTRMIIGAVRNFGLYNPLLAVMNAANRYILFEDQRVLESSDPPEVPDPSQEKSVRTDGPTLAFRRWYLDRVNAARTPVATPGAAVRADRAEPLRSSAAAARA